MPSNTIRVGLSVALLLMATSVYADDAFSESEKQHIQVLAGSCAACHGTNGNALAGNKSLAGIESQHFINKLNDYKSGKQPSTVMHRHAKGLTDIEIRLLAQHFSSLKTKPADLPKHPVRAEDF